MTVTLGILAGDFGFNVTYMAVILAAAVAITVVAVLAILWSTRHPDETDKHSLARYEIHWTILILIVFLLFSFSTIAYLPYPYAHSNIQPSVTVHVEASQFSWCVSNSTFWGTNCQYPYSLPVGQTVLFQVQSKDVTHGFGMYDAQGTLLFQVQVMPNYTNSIMYQFKTPGIYYIRCLEFCGYGHFGMISEVNVTSS